MTLARTALRISAIEALVGNTLADGRVFDSRWSDMNPESYPEEGLACIIVLTDAEEAQQLSEQNGGPPFRREIELVLELSITQAFDVSGETDPETGQPFPDGAFQIAYPQSDRQTEVSLDLLEHQAIAALSYSDAVAARVFRGFARITKKQAHRQGTDQTGNKIAVRVITYTVDTHDDDEPPIMVGETPVSGLEVLPDPLRTVAKSLPMGSPRLQLCQTIAKALTAPDTTPLAGMDIKIDAGEGDNGTDIMDVSIEIQSSGIVPVVIPVGGVATVDYAKGTTQNLILSADTVVEVINWPRVGRTGRIILQVTQLGAFSIDEWPVGTLWSDGGEQPTVTVGAGKIDIFVLTSSTSGAQVFGNIAGQDYS